MPHYARRELVIEDEAGVYHCVARCVRRAFLCGKDAVSGNDYEYRKTWIRDRLQTLASIFGVEVCGYSVMSNHLHLVLRIRPDLVQEWSDREVAHRWRRLFPPRDPATGRVVEPTEIDLAVILADPNRVAVLRSRLAGLSWFMRALSEPIARRANREDKCTGRFWEGRFKVQALLDEAAVLACGIYVDLNPIRAKIAETPEESEFTSAYDRIRAIHKSRCESTANESSAAPAASDAWLCELTLEEGPAAHGEAPAASADPPSLNEEPVVEPATGGKRPTRASDRGFLPMDLEKYLALLDWTGRQFRADKRGAIPDHLAPILERLGVNPAGWLETVTHFDRWFKRAAGRTETLVEAAKRSGRRWLQGAAPARVAFL